MEHILQFGINIDDNAIIKRINESAEKQVIDNITNEVKRIIYARSYYGNGINEHDNTPLKNMVSRKIDEVITENKDVIIAEAGRILADRLSRTKAARTILEEL